MRRLVLITVVILHGLFLQANAQLPSSSTCPPNVNFEQGNLAHWKFYTGACCPISANTVAATPIANRHTLTSGTGVDPFGGFPIVAPDGGLYSLKLGNNGTGAQAEKARYYIRVPAGANNYSLIYRYAVVFQDPDHLPVEQPRFEVKAFDSATNVPIPCAQHTYVASSNLPGFQLSTLGSDVWYKSWTTASLNLAGYAGHTIAVDFASGDCALGAHFGYGYVDMNCGLFQVSSINCVGTTTTLTAPPGFQSYTWMDSTYSTVVGTSASVTIPVPALNTRYNVILTPYPGFGCVDTLFTRVNVSTLSVSATKDTVLCNGGTLQLSAGVAGNAPPYTYVWTGPGLSCTGCASPSVTPTTNGVYTVTVTDATGCVKKDTINVGVSPQISHTVQPINCFAASTGSIAVTATGGGIPTTFSYAWNTVPVQTTPTIAGLSAGLYTVTVSDNHGCVKTATIPVTQPTELIASVSKTDVSCFGGSNGTAAVTATGATPPYSYAWNTSPVQTSPGISALTAGTYAAIVTDSKGCKDTMIASIAQPLPLTVTALVKDRVKCYGGSNAKAYAIANGGTPPYSYQWSTSPSQLTDTASNLTAGTYNVTVTDASGCIATTSISITQPAQLSASALATPALCYGGSTGSVAAIATGGTQPMTYAWNTTPVQTVQAATNMPAGSYTVTITDSAGCTATSTAVVAQPAPLNATLTNSTSVACFGGSNGTAAVAATGGSVPYTYSWNSAPIQTSQAATGLPAGIYTATITDAKGCSDTVSAIITQPVALSATAIKTNDALCYGSNTGKAYVVASGGTQPYSYQWNTASAPVTDTALNLPSGSYTVTVTDGKGCVANATVSISQPAQLVLATSATSAACVGTPTGTASVAVTGGTAPMSYSWSTSPAQTSATAISLAAGIYSVTVTDAKGCIASASSTVTQPSQLSATVSSLPASCLGAANGSGTAVVTGGTPPFSYAWNTSPAQTGPTASNLSAGSYSVSVTDAAGCMVNATALISQPAALNLSLVSSTIPSCHGGTNGTATVLATGGTIPYSYSWITTPIQTNAAATALSAGTHTAVVVDAAGCTDTLAVAIGEPTVLVASATRISDVLCHGGSSGKAYVSASGGSQPYSFQWNSATTQTTDTAGNLAAGTYSVLVTDANGCTTTAAVSITQPAPLVLTTAHTATQCFGTATGTASVSVSGGTAPMSYWWNTVPVQTTASALSLLAGSYAVNVTDANGCVATASAVVPQVTQLSASITSTPALCSGSATGSSSVSAAGGTPPFTYAWNTSPAQFGATATNLLPGTYTVNITDAAGCTLVDTAVVTQPSLLHLSLQSNTPATCFGDASGAATVAASGGTSPYTFSWNTTPAQGAASATALPAGIYVATVVDANGCMDTLQTSISQPTAITATVVKQLDALCSGGNSGKAYVVATGGAAPYTYQWSGNANNQQTDTAAGLSAGSYNVTVTDANGCSASGMVVIGQPAPLSLSTSQTSALCFGTANGSATVNVSGGTAPMMYAWNTTPAQNSATAVALSAGSYSVTVTDDHGCTSTSTIAVAQPAVLSASTTATDAKCFGTATGSSSVAVAGGTAPFTYTWNTSPVQTGAVANALTAGLYTVVVTDAAGCSVTDTSIVSEPAPLDLGLLSSVDVTCFNGTNGHATVVAGGGTGPYSYSWNSTPIQSTPSANSLGAGLYTATVTDAHGCKDSINAAINQPTALTASTSKMSDVLCHGGNNGKAHVVANGGTAPYTYQWSNTSPAQISDTAIDLVAGTYTVMVTDANGCSTTSTVQITQPNALVISTAQTSVLCHGTATGTASAIATGGTSPVTYQWSTAPIQFNSTASALAAGTYTVMAMDANGCAANASIVVTEPASLQLALQNVTNATCYGLANGTASVLGSGGTTPFTYFWNTIPTTTLPIAANLGAGIYTATVTDVNGCQDSIVVTITQPDSIIASAIETHKTCPDDRTGSALAMATGGTAPLSYTWNTTPPQISNVLLNAAPGAYTITVSDANGCAKTTQVTVGAYPKPNVEARGDTSVCHGTRVQLGASGAPSYFWTPATYLSCGACDTPWLNAYATGTYTVIGTNQWGCSDSNAVTVAVYQRQPTTVGPELNICAGESAQLYASGGVSYQWLPGDGLSNTSSAQPIVRPDSSVRYTVLVTESPCFTDTLHQWVKVHPLPTVDAGSDFHALPGVTVSLAATAHGAENISWTPAGGLSCATCLQTQAMLGNTTTTYTATVTSDRGCTASDDVTVTVGCDGEAFFIPNTFTPNGDGQNDRFYPRGRGIATIVSFKVYNRWGEIVFDSRNVPPNCAECGWDGNHQGMQMKPDVYVYIMETRCMDSEILRVKGDISLIR